MQDSESWKTGFAKTFNECISLNDCYQDDMMSESYIAMLESATYYIPPTREYIYCIFCFTQKEVVIVAQLRQFFNGQIFIPTMIRKKKRHGVFTYIKFKTMPGYIFLRSVEEANIPEILKISGVHRFIYRDNDYRVLDESDKAFVDWLSIHDGCIPVVKLKKVGDTVVLDDELFSNCKGTILKVDKRKTRVLVEFAFPTMHFERWLSYDTVDSSG